MKISTLRNKITQCDYMTLIGLSAAIIAIILSICLDGNISAFLDQRSIILVCIGTILLTIACFSYSDTKNIGLLLLKSIIYIPPSYNTTILKILKISEKIRYNGMVEFERNKKNIKKIIFYIDA